MLAAGLAWGLSATSPTPVRFVSHAEHEAFLRSLWGHVNAQHITFLPVPSPPHAAAATHPADVSEALRPLGHMQACMAACGLATTTDDSGPRPRLLVANLFALEAVHLAEALGRVEPIPLVMAHPYPAPTPAPQGFARRLRRTDPLGYRALKLAEQGGVVLDDLIHTRYIRTTF